MATKIGKLEDIGNLKCGEVVYYVNEDIFGDANADVGDCLWYCAGIIVPESLGIDIFGDICFEINEIIDEYYHASFLISSFEIRTGKNREDFVPLGVGATYMQRTYRNKRIVSTPVIAPDEICYVEEFVEYFEEKVRESGLEELLS